MKIIICFIICSFLLFAAGCSSYGYTAWGNALNQWNENYQRELDRQNDYANSFNAGQAQQRNTYWQEQRARQEYLDNFWRYSNPRK